MAFDYLEAHPDCDGVVMTLEDTGERYMFVRADEQKQAADSTN